MNYTEEQINTQVKKLLEDIERPYFEDMPFEISFSNNIKPLFLDKKIENAWDVVVFVNEDQFPDKQDYGVITIVVNDDTGEIESYADLSCGRPIPMKAALSNEKYELVLIEQ